MNLNVIKASEFKFSNDALILPVILDEKLSFSNLGLPSDMIKALNKLIEDGIFSGKDKEVYRLGFLNESGLKTVILAGLGKLDELDTLKLSKAFVAGFKEAKKSKCKSVSIAFRPFEEISMKSYISNVLRNVLVSSYKFDRYLSKKDDTSDEIQEIEVIVRDMDYSPEVESFVNDALNQSKQVGLVRDLVNIPSEDMTPEIMADLVKGYGKEFGYDVEVLGLKQIQKLNMNSFLAVSRGSEKEPKLIVMRYKGNKKSKDNIGLIGKGITFDSGGYCLKPPASMLDMKGDMGGAATVIGAMNLIAQKGLNINVTGVVAACENMISGGAYKVGDVVTTMSGKTVEVDNTDAEGRLTLVDAITYAIEKENASLIIDLATLTGACLVALGEHITGAITNNDKLYESFELASKEAGEYIWKLPLHKDYKEKIKSDIADLKNSGGRMAGTITAGLFIGEFVEDRPWIHLDIAGTSWNDSPRFNSGKGGSGDPLMTLYNFFEGLNS